MLDSLLLYLKEKSPGLGAKARSAPTVRSGDAR